MKDHNASDNQKKGRATSYRFLGPHFCLRNFIKDLVVNNHMLRG